MWQRLGQTDSGDVFSKKKTVVGLMSGTSLDGVDVAVVQLRGTGTSLELKVIAFDSIPYQEDLRKRLLRNSEPESSTVSEITRLHAELAHVYADAIIHVCQNVGISLQDIDLVGSHGQTIYHDPAPAQGPGSTLQIGDPAVLSHLLGIPVVGDFRPADVALGGQGAPLVPYFDWVKFTSPDENRVLLNIGGMANITVLPAGCARKDVVAFDTGPGNVLIDALMHRFQNQPYDAEGKMARSGTVHRPMIDGLMEHAYFQAPPPKSTGRELFNSTYVDQFVKDGLAEGLSKEDLVATATNLTVTSILEGLRRHVPFEVDRLIVSGGGVHNLVLMEGLSGSLSKARVDSILQHGMDPDAKEAVCFAVLAHEAFNGVCTGMPSVTGASGRAFLGKICLPGK